VSYQIRKPDMKTIILLSLLTFAVTAKDYGSATVSKVISVYDGDTFRVSIKIYPPIVGENIAIRVNGIDTPEIRGKYPSEKVLAIKAGVIKDISPHLTIWALLSLEGDIEESIKNYNYNYRTTAYL